MGRYFVTSSEWFLRVENKAKELNHKVIRYCLEQTNDVLNSHTPLELFCNECKTNFEINSIRNYLKVKIGCKNCLAKKNYSFLLPEAKEKAVLAQKAKNAAKREILFDKTIENPSFSVTDIENSLRRVSTIWKGTLWQAYESKCFISSEKGTQEDPLQLHHLYSVSEYPEKQNVLTNGVLIKASFHREFHSLYGNNTTPADFEHYLINVLKKENVIFPWSLEPFKEKAERLKKNIIKDAEIYAQNFEKTVLERDHQIVKYENEFNLYLNRKTLVTITCKLCKSPSTETKSAENYKKQIYGLKCCSSKAISQSVKKSAILPSIYKEPTSRELLKKKLNQKINELGHTFQEFDNSPELLNQHTGVIIYCTKHNKTYTKAYCDYMRSPFGLPCCSSEAGNNKRRETVKKLIAQAQQERDK